MAYVNISGLRKGIISFSYPVSSLDVVQSSLELILVSGHTQLLFSLTSPYGFRLPGDWCQLLLSGYPGRLSGNDVQGIVHCSIGMLINKSVMASTIE